MGEFESGEVVEMGDEAVEFGADLDSGCWVSDAAGFWIQADFLGQGSISRGCADQLAAAGYDGHKSVIRGSETGNGQLVKIEEIQVAGYFLAQEIIEHKAI